VATDPSATVRQRDLSAFKPPLKTGFLLQVSIPIPQSPPPKRFEAIGDIRIVVYDPLADLEALASSKKARNVMYPWSGWLSLQLRKGIITIIR